MAKDLNTNDRLLLDNLPLPALSIQDTQIRPNKSSPVERRMELPQTNKNVPPAECGIRILSVVLYKVHVAPVVHLSSQSVNKFGIATWFFCTWKGWNVWGVVVKLLMGGSE